MYKVYSCRELLEISKTYFHIPTGSIKLDEILRGGIRSSAITEIFGMSGSGKTQMCFELIFNTISSSQGALNNSSAVYISSKKCFFPERVKQFACRYNNKKEGAEINPVNILEKIMYKQVFDYEELAFAVHYLYTIIEENKNHNNIRLIVIDTFSAHLRDMRGFEKIRMSYELIGVLQRIATDYNCAIVLTCDMTPRLYKINRRTDEHTFVMESALGDAFAMRVHQRIELERVNDVISVKMRKALEGKCQQTTIMIDQAMGIVDEPNKLKRKSTGPLEDSDSDEDMPENVER